MSNDKNNEELTRDAERLLQSFVPRAAQLDRDRLMFLAGQATGTTASSPGSVELSTGTAGQASSGTPWFWPATTAGMTTIAAILLVALVLGAEPVERIVIQEKIVYVQQPLAKPQAEVTLVDSPKPVPEAHRVGSTDGHYLRARDLAIAGGIDTLSQPAYRSGGGATAPSSYSDLLEQMVPRKRALSDSPGLSWPVLLIDELNM